MDSSSVSQAEDRERSVDVDMARTGHVPNESELRRFAGCFPTGVAVVTTRDDAGRVYGTTMNSVTCLSLDPPMYLMCFGSNSNTLAALLQSRIFCINFLSVHQEDLSRAFAARNPDKTAGVRFTIGNTGAPVLGGAIAVCEGRLVSSYAGGDHTIAIGQLESVRVTDGEPLVFYRGRYRGLNAM